MQDALHHKLVQDVLFGGAHRAPDSNLPPSKGYAHEHDVHDDDPADDHRNGADHNEHAEKCRANATPQSHIAVFSADEIIIFHIAHKMAPGAQDQTRLVLRRFEVLLAGLDVDRDAGIHSFKTEENGEWNDDEVVLVLAQDVTDLFHNSDHQEFVTADANRSSEGVHAEK